MKLKKGMKSIDFSLPDQDGRNHKLSDYRGQWVLVYFYPKDDTPGCTREACGIRDNITIFKKLDIVTLGISTDSVESHQKFSKKFGLPFTLLSDKDKKVVKQYGVWGKKKFMGRKYMGTFRSSVLIDPRGNVAKVYKQVKPDHHAIEVPEDKKSLATA